MPWLIFYFCFCLRVEKGGLRIERQCVNAFAPAQSSLSSPTSCERAAFLQVTQYQTAMESGLKILKIQLMDWEGDLISIFIVNMIILVKCLHCGINTIKDCFFNFVFIYLNFFFFLSSSLVLFYWEKLSWIPHQSFEETSCAAWQLICSRLTFIY